MDHIANPELLQCAVPDLRGGIPGTLWYGCDQPTRERLLGWYQRQMADQRDDARAARERAMQRILARRHCAFALVAPRGQLARIHTMSIELAALTADVANAITAAPTPPDDAPAASTDKE